MLNKESVGAVVSHPVQYHTILWKKIADSYDLKVLYCSKRGAVSFFDEEFGEEIKWDIDLLKGYKYKFFDNWGFEKRSSGRLKYLNPGVALDIVVERYDVVYIHSFGHYTSLLALLAAYLVGSKIISRSIDYNLDNRRDLSSALRKLVYRAVYSLVDVCLFIGEHNKKYFESFGVENDKLIFAPHIVDNEYFSRECKKIGKKNIKKKKNIPVDKKVMLFCGKLIEKKQPLLLLEAFFEASIDDEWMLVFVGEGRLKNEVNKKIKEEYENSKVRVEGFVNQTKLPQYYKIAELLVLPSKYGETWGLVVNEAMCCGTSIIVSDKVGCGPDLVKDCSGLVFHYKSRKELTSCIEKVANNDGLRKEFQRNSILRISNWGSQEFMKGFNKAVNI